MPTSKRCYKISDADILPLRMTVGDTLELTVEISMDVKSNPSGNHSRFYPGDSIKLKYPTYIAKGNHVIESLMYGFDIEIRPRFMIANDTEILHSPQDRNIIELDILGKRLVEGQ